MLDVQTREIARVDEGRHRAPDDGLSTMEFIAQSRMRRAVEMLPDPDSGAGWALQLFTTVFVGTVACGVVIVAMVSAIEFWTQVAP
jgi:hypothetical protein